MSRAGERTVLIEPLYDEDGLMAADRARAAEVVNDLLGALLALGGRLEVLADRVKLGELPGAHDGKPTILAETVGLIVRYTPSAPLNEHSVTARAMQVAQGDGGLEPVSDEPDEGEE